MEILFVLIPLSGLVVLGAIAIFFHAVDTGQFDDLERHGRAALFEEHSEHRFEGEPHDATLDRNPVQPR
jgi:cbb3-type cytochrome oxidase maturation protein